MNKALLFYLSQVATEFGFALKNVRKIETDISVWDYERI